jgi:hypothetical protein
MSLSYHILIEETALYEKEKEKEYKKDLCPHQRTEVY